MQRKLLVVALVLGVAGCVSNSDPQPQPTPPAVQTTTNPGSATPVDPPTTIPPMPPRSTGPVICPEVTNWRTDVQEAAVHSPFEMYNVRTARHPCFDRVVFDINGRAPVGYHVGYVPKLTQDGSGHPVFVEGGAVLQVVIRSQLQGHGDSGHQPGKVFIEEKGYFYTAEQLAGYEALRAIRFAGFFEGQSTIGIGVANKRPFHVHTWADSNDITHVVVDVAHP